MPQTAEFASVWTAVDLVERLGPIPLDRIRTNPPPGSATERDVIEIHDRENRLCELLDGTLVEKTAGCFESYLAMKLGCFLATFIQDNDLGIVLGADGMVRLVWYVYPETREVRVYESPEKCVARATHETLDDGDALPGFQLPLARLFREPGESD
jgi:hypothetical protein